MNKRHHRRVTFLLLLVLLVATALGSHAFGEEEILHYPELISTLEQYTLDPIVAESYADFDGDGTIDGFFQTQLASDEYSRSIWYVSEEEVVQLYDEAYVFLGETETIGDYSFQYVYGKKWNELYGVKEGEVVLLTLPEDLEIQQIYRDEETGDIYGVEWDWSDSGERLFIHHLLAFDAENFEFTDMHETFVAYEED